MDTAIKYREINDSDRQWIEDLMTSEWGAPLVVSKGKLHDTLKLPGIVAELDRKPVGLATYAIDGNNCELVTVNSMAEGKGIGTSLINKIKQIAKEKKCHRVWMITTNDNTHALKFYQKRGFTMCAIYPNAIEQSRKLKPQIPLTGNDGIPIRDEIELEMII